MPHMWYFCLNVFLGTLDPADTINWVPVKEIKRSFHDSYTIHPRNSNFCIKFLNSNPILWTRGVPEAKAYEYIYIYIYLYIAHHMGSELWSLSLCLNRNQDCPIFGYLLYLCGTIKNSKEILGFKVTGPGLKLGLVLRDRLQRGAAEEPWKRDRQGDWGSGDVKSPGTSMCA